MRSESQKRLLGYVQVYDMQGLSWRHYSSREIADKLKTALQSGSFYVEAVSHMYVINASRLFSVVWKAGRGPFPQLTCFCVFMVTMHEPNQIAKGGDALDYCFPKQCYGG